jgi:CBS domain containing-hemolysin-like protein
VHDLERAIGAEGLAGGHPFITLARLVLDDVKRIPVVGEVVVVSGWRIEVAEIAGNRIERLLVSRVPDMSSVQASEHVVGLGTAGSAALGGGERPGTAD